MALRGGQPGNRNATKAKLWEQAITRACRPSDLAEIAEMVVQQAKDGQQWAVQEIGNRLDGKPVQAVEMDANVNTNDPRTMSDAELLQICSNAAQALGKRRKDETLQ